MYTCSDAESFLEASKEYSVYNTPLVCSGWLIQKCLRPPPGFTEYLPVTQSVVDLRFFRTFSTQVQPNLDEEIDMYMKNNILDLNTGTTNVIPVLLLLSFVKRFVVYTCTNKQYCVNVVLLVVGTVFGHFGINCVMPLPIFRMEWPSSYCLGMSVCPFDCLFFCR